MPSPAANRLWISDDSPVVAAFAETLRRDFDADAHRFDPSRPVDAGEAINRWVADHTRGRITHLLNGLDRDAALVLLNAVAFHAQWQERFDELMTEDEPFFSEDGSTPSVPLMSCHGALAYVEERTFEAVEIPYAVSPLAMLVLLPTARDGLEALEGTLTADLLARTVSRLRPTPIHMRLPRFTVESRPHGLADHLAALGLPTAFQRGVADFSGINGFAPRHAQSLYISGLEHLATIDVDEAGTEATAVTAVRVVRTSAPLRRPRPVPTFRADHPFLFAIRHRRSSAIVFLGRVADPRT
jgi:serpin B